MIHQVRLSFSLVVDLDFLFFQLLNETMVHHLAEQSKHFSQAHPGDSNPWLMQIVNKAFGG